ncbi:MAG: TetR/AcrR family transcriptional regulator [Novosphingobium sp.]|nr:TetR/AcrR family transcriptional regulator [Novosphingobium sp.]
MAPVTQHDPSTGQNAPSTDCADHGQTDHGHGAEPGSRRGRPSLEEAQRLPSRILEAGWEVLAEHGFDNFTFDRIARHARIGKVTIYNRFPGKREFLSALLKYKIEKRRVSIMAVGAGLPHVESFCQRAVTVVEIMLSPEGVLMERLLDWCDQEFGQDDVNYRLAMYDDAIVNIEAELRKTVQEQALVVRDVSLAARFWLEGLLGHARFLGHVRTFDREETERWARSYSEFFFAALRG